MISRVRTAAVFLPLATWTVYVFVAVSIGSIGCGHGRIAGVDVRRLALVVIAVLAAALLAANAASAGRRVRSGNAETRESGAVSFLYLLSIAASGLALLFLLWVLAAALAEPACA